MSEERRDIQSVLSDIRVDVATVKERTASTTQTLAEIKEKLELGVFREEYERRHKEVEESVDLAVTEARLARDETLRREGANRVWRWVFAAAISVLGLLEVFFRH